MKGICDEGVLNLVAGIVRQAASDVVDYSPDSKNRQDAEAFFRSGYFTFLTGMDGVPILEELEARAVLKKGRSKRRKMGKEIPCE